MELNDKRKLLLIKILEEWFINHTPGKADLGPDSRYDVGDFFEVTDMVRELKYGKEESTTT